MRINEVSGSEHESARLAALTQFLVARAKDTNARKKISTEAFLKLARGQGISLTADQLKTLAVQPPLSNLIQEVNDNEITFKGAGEEQVSTTMTVDQARKTVDQMAKRAVKRDL